MNLPEIRRRLSTAYVKAQSDEARAEIAWVLRELEERPEGLARTPAGAVDLGPVRRALTETRERLREAREKKP